MDAVKCQPVLSRGPRRFHAASTVPCTKQVADGSAQACREVRTSARCFPADGDEAVQQTEWRERWMREAHEGNGKSRRVGLGALNGYTAGGRRQMVTGTNCWAKH